MRSSIILLARAACLLGLSALAACGPTFIAESTTPMDQTTAAQRRAVIGWGEVDCIVQPDRTLGRCRIVEASPDTAEVREGALQGMRMHGNGDLPAEAKPGDHARRRVNVALQ